MALKKCMKRTIDRCALKPLGFSLLCFLFFFLWAFMVPYTGDDWAWGSSIGIRRLMAGFQNYNGRYLGNLLVILMTRSRILRALIMAISYFLACWQISQYAEEKNKLYYAFSVLLFLLMPKSILRESVVWTSGFANYFPSALVSVVLFIVGTTDAGLLMEKDTRVSGVRFFLLTFCGSLFMEHITLFHIFWSLCLLYFYKKKHDRILYIHWGMLTGSLSGAVCMFSNTVYWDVVTVNDNYQQIADSISEFFYIMGRHGSICLHSLVVDNGKICFLLSVFLILLCRIFSAESDNSAKKKLAWAGTMINIICLMIILGMKLLQKNVWILIIQGILAAIYAILIPAVICLCVKEPWRNKLLLPVFCILAVSFPLLFVYPVGARCCLVSYFFLAAFAVRLFRYINTHLIIRKKNSTSFLMKYIYAAVMICMLFYGIIYQQNYVYDEKRNAFAKLQSAQGANTIIVCTLPYDSYLHCSAPASEPWDYRYKLFHGLNDHAVLEVVEPTELDQLIR